MRVEVARGALELTLAAAASLACCAAWSHVGTMVVVAPIIGGEPETWSTHYDPRGMLLTLLLATVAGVLAVIGLCRLARLGAAATRRGGEHLAASVPPG